MGYSLRLAARVLLYASSHRQDNTNHSLCYTSRGALAETRNSSMGPPWRIDPTTHHTISERSYHGATSRFHGKILINICICAIFLDMHQIQHNIRWFWSYNSATVYCCWCCLYVFSCLYPLKFQARYPGHTPQLSGLCIIDSELVGSVSVLVVNERAECIVAHKTFF